MDKRILQNILQFLQRVQLQGNEAEALVECKMVIQEELKKEAIQVEDK